MRGEHRRGRTKIIGRLLAAPRHIAHERFPVDGQRQRAADAFVVERRLRHIHPVEIHSKGIAEAIVLGKSLQVTLKSIAQSILIDIITAQVKTLANLALEIVLNKAITAEKQQQAFFSSIGGGSGGSFLGSLVKIGMSADVT